MCWAEFRNSAHLQKECHARVLGCVPFHIWSSVLCQFCWVPRPFHHCTSTFFYSELITWLFHSIAVMRMREQQESILYMHIRTLVPFCVGIGGTLICSNSPSYNSEQLANTAWTEPFQIYISEVSVSQYQCVFVAHVQWFGFGIKYGGFQLCPL